MIAVIMQPTYLPWIGYFDLMDTADVFVLLDTVQFEKQAWQQRNRIKTAENQSKWLTVPVIQNLGQKMNEVKTGNSSPWCRKHWGTIEQYYKRAEYWKQYCDELKALYDQSWEYLLTLNVATINFLKKQLGVKTKLMRASEIPVSGEKVKLLTNICHYLEADIYLSPVRAADYIEQDNVFAQEGITLVYHRYEHPVYKQMFEGFISHMSAIDLLFNEGPKSLAIIRSGRLDYDVPLQKQQ
ncbi:MAG: WbqC family protein [Candidatus Omnitrophota bacterium]|jgi:hypothetical protein